MEIDMSATNSLTAAADCGTPVIINVDECAGEVFNYTYSFVICD